MHIAIQQPCSAKFNNFEKTALGGFCKSCTKEVIDFTGMTPDEVMAYFTTKNENTCGQFFKSQLKTYNISHRKKYHKKKHFISALGFSVISLFSSQTFTAQKSKPNMIEKDSSTSFTHKEPLPYFTIKGHITSLENGMPIAGASVVLKNSVIGTVTDFDGNFELTKVQKGAKLSFYYLGFKAHEITIQKKEPFLHIVMEQDEAILSELVTVGKVNIQKSYTTKRTLWQRIKSLF